MKWLNEILHRVTSKIQVERLERHIWQESAFIGMVSGYIKESPEISGLVADAISQAYEHVNEIKN